MEYYSATTKEWTTDTCNNTDGSQLRFMKETRCYPTPQIAHTLRFHLDKILGNANLCRMTKNRSVVAWKREARRITRGPEKTLGGGEEGGGVGMHIILTVLMASWAYMCKTHQIARFKYVSLLYDNYTSIKVFEKKKRPLKHTRTHIFLT